MLQGETSQQEGDVEGAIDSTSFCGPSIQREQLRTENYENMSGLRN